MIENDIIKLIGNTPFIELKNIEEKYNLKAKIYAKIERFNPFGSIKDRPSLEMLSAAFKDKKIDKDTTVIEATSGNTGIALSALCSSYNIKCIIVMPENMSVERRRLISSYGAKVILTSSKDGMSGAINKVEELKKEIPNHFIPDQFNNMNNPLAHYKSTGPEIFNALDGNIDTFVSGIGSGGTITGCSMYFKEKNKNIKIVGFEPSSSPFISQKRKGVHKIQGIGAGFIPNILNISLIDEVVTISDEEAYSFTKLVNSLECLGVGISSGATLACMVKEALKDENKGKNIVGIFPDGIDKYLSSDLFNL